MILEVQIQICCARTNICATIVFKAKSKQKHKEKIFLGGFSLKTKNALFGGSKIVPFKSQILNCISAFVL